MDGIVVVDGIVVTVVEGGTVVAAGTVVVGRVDEAGTVVVAGTVEPGTVVGTVGTGAAKAPLVGPMTKLTKREQHKTTPAKLH